MISLFSECGAYHVANGQKNQDYVISDEDERFLVIALADGVSSRRLSACGARTACCETKNMLLSNGSLFFEFEKEKVSFYALAQIVHKLKQLAEEQQVEISEFASTISFALVDKLKRKMIILNLGDNMILSYDGRRVKFEAEPDNDTDGCCTTTTKMAFTCAKTEIIDCNTLDSIILMSDGAWKTIFERGKIKKQYEQAVISGDFSSLCKILKNEKYDDDCSFAAIDFKAMRLRGDF